MLKDVIMLGSVALLLYMGWQVEKRKRATHKSILTKLSMFYFALGISILMYYIRDFYVANEALDLLFYRIGAMFQGLSFLLIFLFSIDIFYSESRFKMPAYILAFLIFVMFSIGMWTFHLEREMQVFYLDKKYEVTRVFFPIEIEKIIITLIGIFASTLPTLSFVIYGLRDKNSRKKAFLYATGMVVMFAGSMLCYLISPLLARSLYLVGAIICYYAFKMR